MLWRDAGIVLRMDIAMVGRSRTSGLGASGYGGNIIEYNRLRFSCMRNYDMGAINCWVEDNPDPGGDESLKLERDAVRSGHVFRYCDYATATFKAHPAALDGTFRILLHHHARFQINIGSWGLQWEGQWWLLPSDPWREGIVYQPSVKEDRPQELALSLRGGRLDAGFAGQTLARNVPVEGLGARSYLELKTWGGDWMAFELLDASSAPTQLFEDAVCHPVL